MVAILTTCASARDVTAATTAGVSGVSAVSRGYADSHINLACLVNLSPPATLLLDSFQTAIPMRATVAG
jgi:hypothetical protein